MDFDVRLTFYAPHSVDHDQLEQHMFTILDAVEQRTPHGVLGPVVAANLADHSIELAYTVQADTPSSVQKTTGAILELIEQHTQVPVRDIGTDARQPCGDEPAYALA